jgi:UDP-sugar transporter A1/2/3
MRTNSLITHLSNAIAFLFQMALLQRRLSGTKWRALVLIVVASVLVSTPYIDDDDDDSETSEEAAESDSSISAGSLSLGFGAVLVEVLLSGAASVYFEKVVKSADEQFTLWERNVQLGVYSICLYVGMLVYDAAANGKDIGSGWSWVTLIVAMLGAAGGLLVALSLKYADAILKALATSGAIVLSSLGGWALLNGPMTLPVALGCVVAIVATMNYTFDDMSLPESNHAEGTVSKVPAAI